jgi:hypothetical protein
MIRVLVMIAVAGFILSVATLSAAIAIGGPEALSHAAWTWGANRNWEGHWDGHNRWDWDADSSPQTTREMAWTGGDSLEVDVPAEVRYTQAPGPAKLTITGSKRAVEDVEISDGHVRFVYRRHRHYGGKLVIVMTAPNITSFDMHGSSTLAIESYKQDKLRIDLSGNADVAASGEVDVVKLDVSGSAEADLGKLKAKGAEVDIAGSGEATIAPTDWAKVDISGSGDVTLLTNPAKLDTDISGSGSIHREEGASPAPPPEPTPTPTPSKSGKRL